MQQTGQPAREITIDTARLRDIPAVARIQRQAFRHGLAYSPFALGVLWLMPGVTFLVARDAATGEPVGNVIVDRYRGNARIVNLAVATAARRQGIGRQLIRVLDARCPEGDVVLSVEAENAGAQRLYEQEGFVRTAMLKDYYGAGQHGYTMKKSRRARAASVTAP